MGNELSTRAMQTLDNARQAIVGLRVFGEAYEVGDVTVIPVSVVRGGGGAGGGEGQGPERPGRGRRQPRRRAPAAARASASTPARPACTW